MSGRWTIFLSIITLILIIVTISISSPVFAEEFKIHLAGVEMTGELVPEIDSDQLLVRARALSDHLGIELKWFEAIKTLRLVKDKTTIKMMANNPYIQVNNNTYKTETGLKIIDGHGYIPLKETVEAFGYLFQRTGKNIYVSKPESLVKGISWRQKGKQLVVEMDQLAPYRISRTDDPRKIILELDKASLAKDFSDQLSNKNFYLKIDKIEDNARLKLMIISKYPIPFSRDSGVDEEGSNLVINFLPCITSIDWHDQKLEIKANGKIEEPEVFLMQDPRRLVIDISGLMLSNYDLNIPDNDWIKEIRVSQFKYDPVILRLVIELKEGSYLHIKPDEHDEMLILEPSQVTRVSEISCDNNLIRFVTDKPVKPDIFTLKEPDRLVINLLNTVRGRDVPDLLENNKGIIQKVRTARFNEETVRIVADLSQLKGYSWSKKELSNGRYENIIVLGNEVADINILDSNNKTDIVINFTGETEYEVERVSDPERLVVNLYDVDIEEELLPGPTGLVKKINLSLLESDQKGRRIIFELEDFKDYFVYSSSPSDSIKLTLARNEMSNQEVGDIIVIDPGHGGFDPGAVGPSGLTEKEVNLAIGLKVASLLEKKGYEVLMTRNRDYFISLRERVKMANECKAKLFVSIHSNAATGDYSEGTETFLAPEKGPVNELLASFLQENMVRILKRFDRGIKTNNFYVIKYTEMPAALVEVAFISNPHEESLLANELFKEKAATAIVSGILAYLEKTEQGVEGSNE